MKYKNSLLRLFIQNSTANYLTQCDQLFGLAVRFRSSSIGRFNLDIKILTLPLYWPVILLSPSSSVFVLSQILASNYYLPTDASQYNILAHFIVIISQRNNKHTLQILFVLLHTHWHKRTLVGKKILKSDTPVYLWYPSLEQEDLKFVNITRSVGILGHLNICIKLR